MNITVFLDGSPGHEKQSQAILQSLQEFEEVTIQEIKLEKTSFLDKVVGLIRLVLFPDGGCRYDVESAQILLGTGTTTHIPMLSCKKKYSLPAVVCMAPDFYLRKQFDLCFVPRHDGLTEQSHIFLTDGPPVLAPADLPEDESRGLILIGGIDSSSHYWESSQLVEYIEKITTEEHGKKWNVSSSPRTPGETCEKLKRLAEKTQNIEFFDYHETPQGWVEQQYAESSVVWVTVDSMSMVYEALTAGCRVGLLPLRWKNESNKFRKSMDLLVSRRLAVWYQDWEKGRGDWNLGQRFNEAKRCADEIRARWFKKS